MHSIRIMVYTLTTLSLLGGTICQAQTTKKSAKDSNTNPMPNIIPAIQKWSGSTGAFDIGAASITTPEPALLATINLLRQDLLTSGATKNRLPLTSAGTISFKIVPNGDNPGAYSITITPDSITASASTPTGIFYATQSLLQMAMQSPNIPCGYINDYPAYRIRSLMLDTGRKFFPFEALKDYIRVLGFLKMSELHLHLSDNSFGAEIYPGFRIECETMPELTNKDGFYTKTQIRELQDFAKLRGITITPEIDAPGHAFCFTRLRPDLRHPKLGDAYLDVLNPGTTKLMQAIFDEFIPLFDAPDVHIGTDEYRRGRASKEEWAALGEGFRQYINTMNRYIRKKHGKNVRIWSGWEHMPGKTQPDTNIIIDMWVSSDAKSKSALGYKYINSNHGRTYIVPGAGYYGVSNPGLYNGWTPAVFTGNKERDPAPGDPNLLGAKLHVWNDMGPNGYTMYEIADLAIPTLFVMSEKMWGTKGSPNYQAFQQRVAKLTNIPDVRLLQRGVSSSDPATGLVFDSGDKTYTLQSPQDSIPLVPYLEGADDAHKNLEFPWTATMLIKPTGNQTTPAAILSSRIAELQADLRYTTSKKDRKTKKVTKIEHSGIGFSRLDKYSSTPLRGSAKSTREATNTMLPTGRFSRLTFVGHRRNTVIYLDGKKIGSFSGSRAQTICPLEFVGAYPGRSGGFTGQIRDLKIFSKALTPQQVAAISGIKPLKNIAKGCFVSASKADTAYNLTADKLTDGNTDSRSSRWSSGPTKDPASVTIDLGKVRNFNAIKLYWEAAYPGVYSIETSEDGSKFTKAITGFGAPKPLMFRIRDTEARYIRINMRDPATQWGYSLYEIEVFKQEE